MTAIVPAPTKAPAKPAAPTTGNDRRAQTTAALAGQRDHLERPFRDLERVVRKDPNFGWLTAVHPVPDELWLPGHPAAPASRWLASLPDGDDLSAIHNRVEAALETAPDERPTAVSLGLLLNAYPQTKEAREGYFATALHVLLDEGFSPHMVAEACRNLRRVLKFPPSVAELVEAGTKAREHLRFGLVHIDRLAGAQAAALSCVAAYDTPAADWPEAWWVNAICQYRRNVPRRAWDDRLGPCPDERGCIAPADLLRQWGYGRAAA